MEQALRRWPVDHDERSIDDAFFDNDCPQFFAVDWREDNADIVQYCADCLGDDLVRAEWRDDSLVIIRDGNETTVRLANDEGDRDVTIRYSPGADLLSGRSGLLRFVYIFLLIHNLLLWAIGSVNLVVRQESQPRAKTQ